MEDKKQPAPAQVAASFVEQYYLILSKSPENVHRFYQETSLLGWPGLKPVTTLSGINKKIMSTDYKDCAVEVKTTDSQESQGGGIMALVTGCLTGKDNVKKNFSQTFFLAKQENGYFVLNDILQIFDICKSRTDATDNSDDENDQSVSSTKNSVLASARCDTFRGPTSLNFKAAIQNGKVEASEHSVSENIIANASTSSIPSGEVGVPPVEGAKPRLVATPTTNGKVRVNPASNVKVPSFLTPHSHVALKNTYASVLAKATPAPRGDVSLRVSTPSGGVSKAPTSPSKVMPKSPTTGGPGATTSSAYTEAKGIYIGGLPYKITKQGIVDVVKQFGIVRRYSETVQIRRCEDGFYCGFVEFESADSARRAVEVHHVMFGDKEAYITYKRQHYNHGMVERPNGL